jgi:hypothetical protein
MTNNQVVYEHEGFLPENQISPYLKEGFAKENVEFGQIILDRADKTAKSLVSVWDGNVNTYHESENGWHWSAITAYRAVAQLAIMYICDALDSTKNEIGEIMQISHTMNTRRPIASGTDIPVELKFPKFIRRNNRVFGELEFSVNEGDFDGKMRFTCNVPKPRGLRRK